MGLIKELDEAKTRAHTPKIAFVSPPQSYTASSGKVIGINDIDLNVRALSMGQLHHAMMGTASVSIGCAACVPGTLVNLACGGGEKDAVTFGHPSGVLKVGATILNQNGKFIVESASMSRSARVIMDGYVYVPSDIMD
jgi:2-methylaconitate cis-trans-isomerase PrpF